MGFLTAATLITVGVGAAVFGGRGGAIAAFAASLYFSANSIANLGQHVQAGRRRFHRSAGTDVVAGVLFPVLTYAALKLNAGVNGCLIAIATACAISCTVAWTRLPELEFGAAPSPLRIRDGLSFTAFGLVYAGYGRIDTVTLLAVAGSGAAGYYSASYKLLGPFTLIGAAFGIFYFSRISEFSRDQARWTRIRKRGSIILAITSITLAAILILLTPWIIRFVFGPHYEASVRPARILLLSVIPWSLYWLKPSELASVHLELRATISLGAGLLLDFLLVATLGKRYGPSGAAWAWLASESVILLALTLASRNIANRVQRAPHDKERLGEIKTA